MTNHTQIKDFTKGDITKDLLVFAWPLFLSNLLQIVYNMVDMIVVGHTLGKVGTSAIAIGGDISALMTFVAMGFSSAGQVLIARLIGKKKTEDLARFVATMSGFLIFCALLISTLALRFQDTLLTLMNTPMESYKGAYDYSMICMFGLVFIYGYNIVSAILRGMGDSKHPFIFIAVAAVLNIILDITFVVYLDFGVGGAALATIISQATSCILCTLFIYKNKEKYALHIRLLDFFIWDKEMLKSLIKLGTPMAIKSAAVQFSKLFVNSWINSYGVEVSAFAGIANKVSSIANLVSNAMNTAGSTMVGQNLAANQFERVKQILIRLATITLTIATTISIFIIFFPTELFSIFTSDKAVLAIADYYVPIAILLFFGAALRSCMNALINGSGNFKINFATAILDGFVMRIGLSLLFGLVFDLKHYGFWLGDALAGFTPFIVGMIFYYSGEWKRA